MLQYNLKNNNKNDLLYVYCTCFRASSIKELHSARYEVISVSGRSRI